MDEDGGKDLLTCVSIWREKGFEVSNEQMQVSLARFSATAATMWEVFSSLDGEALASAAASDGGEHRDWL